MSFFPAFLDSFPLSCLSVIFFSLYLFFLILSSSMSRSADLCLSLLSLSLLPCLLSLSLSYLLSACLSFSLSLSLSPLILQLTCISVLRCGTAVACV